MLTTIVSCTQFELGCVIRDVSSLKKDGNAFQCFFINKYCFFLCAVMDQNVVQGFFFPSVAINIIKIFIFFKISSHDCEALSPTPSVCLWNKIVNLTPNMSTQCC